MGNHQLHDPDFDPPMTATEDAEESLGFFEGLSAKTLFIGGVVMGAMTLCTIGFFILLGILFTGD